MSLFFSLLFFMSFSVYPLTFSNNYSFFIPFFLFHPIFPSGSLPRCQGCCLSHYSCLYVFTCISSLLLISVFIFSLSFHFPAYLFVRSSSCWQCRCLSHITFPIMSFRTLSLFFSCHSKSVLCRHSSACVTQDLPL